MEVRADFLADSRSGYCYNLEIYADKRAETVDQVVEVGGVTHSSILHIASPCFVKGHHLYFDNYFTSPGVLNDLALHGIGACGTLRVV